MNRKAKPYSFLATTFIAVSCLTSCTTPICNNTDSSTNENLSAELAKTFTVITNDRSEIGTVTLSEVNGEVLAHVKVSGISPGKHGVHFHAVADCSDAKFLNTTGHINIHGHQHGLHNPNGPDNADLPNLLADTSGRVDQVLRSPRVTLKAGNEAIPSLFDVDGSALVIHAEEDDQITQPIGGAGSRIGCAEIK